MLTKNETFILAKLNTLEHINAQMLVLFSEIASMEGKPSILDALFVNLRENLKGRPFVLEGKGEGAYEVQAEMDKQLDHFAALIDFYERKTTLN
jgi:hypothetical protein